MRNEDDARRLANRLMDAEAHPEVVAYMIEAAAAALGDIDLAEFALSLPTPRFRIGDAVHAKRLPRNKKGDYFSGTVSSALLGAGSPDASWGYTVTDPSVGVTPIVFAEDELTPGEA